MGGEEEEVAAKQASSLSINMRSTVHSYQVL